MRLAEKRLKKVISDFNDRNECGFCWVFWKPEEDQFKRPLYDHYGDCCGVVEVQMLRYQQIIANLESARMVINQSTLREVFDLELRVMTKAGDAIWIPDGDSIYKDIMEPLYECYLKILMDCQIRDRFILEDASTTEMNKSDENFSGLKISVAYKTYLR